MAMTNDEKVHNVGDAKVDKPKDEKQIERIIIR